SCGYRETIVHEHHGREKMRRKSRRNAKVCVDGTGKVLVACVCVCVCACVSIFIYIEEGMQHGVHVHVCFCVCVSEREGLGMNAGLCTVCMKSLHMVLGVNIC